MNKRLEQIREFISPFENRIKSIEAEKILEATGYHILGFTECAIRGAVVGYIIGALASGSDEKYSIGVAAIGMILDGTQDILKKFNWMAMKGADLGDYQDYIRYRKRRLRINYGRYTD